MLQAALIMKTAGLALETTAAVGVTVTGACLVTTLEIMMEGVLTLIGTMQETLVLLHPEKDACQSKENQNSVRMVYCQVHFE